MGRDWRSDTTSLTSTQDLHNKQTNKQTIHTKTNTSSLASSATNKYTTSQF